MYRYVSDVSSISHYIVKSFCANFDNAIDATLGNGNDSDFLSSIFKNVYAFDIQHCAVCAYKEKKIENVIVIEDSHEHMDRYVFDKVDCIMFNLGFLPGGDKSITTKYDSTIKSLELALKLLKSGGIITIAVYSGHDEGKKERLEVIKFLEFLPKNQYGVLSHNFINRTNNPPELYVIEKK